MSQYLPRSTFAVVPASRVFSHPVPYGTVGTGDPLEEAAKAEHGEAVAHKRVYGALAARQSNAVVDGCRPSTYEDMAWLAVYWLSVGAKIAYANKEYASESNLLSAASSWWWAAQYRGGVGKNVDTAENLVIYVKDAVSTLKQNGRTDVALELERYATPAVIREAQVVDDTLPEAEETKLEELAPGSTGKSKRPVWCMLLGGALTKQPWSWLASATGVSVCPPREKRGGRWVGYLAMAITAGVVGYSIWRAARGRRRNPGDADVIQKGGHRVSQTRLRISTKYVKYTLTASDAIAGLGLLLGVGAILFPPPFAGPSAWIGYPVVAGCLNHFDALPTSVLPKVVTNVLDTVAPPRSTTVASTSTTASSAAKKELAGRDWSKVITYGKWAGGVGAVGAVVTVLGVVSALYLASRVVGAGLNASRPTA